jgi:flagellar biosynthesis/type III secretory pathway protein FliH
MRDHLGREKARREEFQNCLEGIDRAVESIASTVNSRLDDVAALVTELGIALAREVLGTAIEKGLADPTATVARCLRDTVGGADSAAEVFLAPDDLRAVLDRLQTQPDLQKYIERARFTADPDLERGAVRIETEAGRLLYEPREVLQRISDEVRREMSK